MKREAGTKPALPRSGMWKRPPSHALGEAREAADSRRKHSVHEPEYLPRPEAHESVSVST